MIWIHNLLHKFWKPRPKHAILEAVFYGAMLQGVPSVHYGSIASSLEALDSSGCQAEGEPE